MFSYAECALMADAVYHVVETPRYSSIVELAKAGCVYGGANELAGPLYRSAIWRRGGSTAFVVRGTMPVGGHGQNLGQDAMMKLASEAPYGLIKAAVQHIRSAINPPFGSGMFVGHSLGGSAAQVLGLLYGLPFMTFNAPGMRYDLMRKGWVRTLSDINGSVGGTLLTMLPVGRDLANSYVEHTRGKLDQDYDQARLEMAQKAGISVPDSTATFSPDSQLGFNIAHQLDEIHTWLGPPIGAPWRYANWAPSVMGAVAAAAIPADAVYYYHDSKRLADFIVQQAWGGARPVQSMVGAKGRVFYYRAH